ncbi:hypothetical protein B0H19DRAFT_1383151 [Mycena capillaripes]|nr:hypothetical protein B0H19DRAFT_1383151 [Mycena capillaripes]
MILWEAMAIRRLHILFGLSIPITHREFPLTNRLVDNNKNYLTTFTFPDPAKAGPDPRIVAPLAVGDCITLSGIKTPAGTLAIYSLEANLGIYTAKGTQPAAVAFATVLSVTVQWSAMDNVTERNLSLAQGSSVAPIGKITYRFGKTDVSPAARQVDFRYSTGTSPAERDHRRSIHPTDIRFIFPELIAFGDQQIPLEFKLIPFLAQGSGPFVSGTRGAAALTRPPIVGQLSPWPGSLAPQTTACPLSSTAHAAPATPAADAQDGIKELPSRDRCLIPSFKSAPTRRQAKISDSDSLPTMQSEPNDAQSYDEQWRTEIEPTLASRFHGNDIGYGKQMEIYKLVYNACTSVPNEVRAVHDDLVEFFVALTRRLHDGAPEALLDYYIAQWDVFAAGVAAIEFCIFLYFDRYLVNRHGGLDTVAAIAFKSRKANILEPLTSRLKEEIQHGALIDQALAAFIPENFTGSGVHRMQLQRSTPDS